MKYKYVYLGKYTNFQILDKINFYEYFNKYLNIFKYIREIKIYNNKFNNINSFIFVITY